MFFLHSTLCALHAVCVRTKLAHVGLRHDLIVRQIPFYFADIMVLQIYLQNSDRSKRDQCYRDRSRMASKENQVYLAELQKRHYSWRHLLGVSRKKKQILESF